MRQATGELNATVIIFSAVALLTAVFFMIVWPLVKEGFYESASCSNAVCDNGYLPGGAHEGMTTCYNPQDDAKELFYCPYRG